MRGPAPRGQLASSYFLHTKNSYGKKKVYHLSNLNMFTKRLESCLLTECYFLSVSALKEEQLITVGHVVF